MKKKLRSLWEALCGIRGLSLILYCTLILAADAFVSHDSMRYVLRSVFLIFIACLFLCPLVLKRAQGLAIRTPALPTSLPSKKKISLLFFVIPFLLFFTLYLIHYPGGFSNDTFDQYKNAVNNSYSDWHPVFHTLLAIKLPLLLTGGWVGSIVLFQIIILSAALSYAFSSLLEYAGVKFTVLALVFILLNPQTWIAALYPWKDTAFGVGALLLTTYLMHIHFTKGQWIKAPLHTTAFIIVLVCTTMFRHNAILFTLPLLIASAFCISKKRSAVICLSCLVLLIGIKGPLYSALEVRSPGSRQIETLGLPMTVIGGVVANDPDALDEETKEFAYAIAPQEVWESKYVYGSYNNVKWAKVTNNDVIEEYGAKKVLSMMVRCFVRSPITATTALIKLTAPVYTISDDYLLWDAITVSNNSFGIQSSGVPILKPLVRAACAGLPLLFPHIFMYFGVIHLILLIAILAKCKFKRVSGWRKILAVLPVFAYNFGTALLLTGFADVARFDNYTRWLFPILFVILFREQKEGGAGAPPAL